MSMGLSYGSFGDIITTIRLVTRLAHALSQSHGSSRDFQELVVELRLYQNVLQQLSSLWERKKQCPELDELGHILRPAIADSQSTIESFLKKTVKKYGTTLLRQAGSPRTFWDLVKMIRWDLCEKDDVRKLRDRLSQSKATLQLAQIQALGICDDGSYAILSDRITSLIYAEQQAESKIEGRFSGLMDQVKEGTNTLSTINTLSNSKLNTVSTVSRNVSAMKATLHTIEQAMFEISVMIKRLNFYTRQNTVFIEDALGWTIPILIDTHPSWETVHSILLDQFTSHRPHGLELVRSKRYTFHNSGTGIDVQSSIPFYQVARPGQSFEMSMIFYHEWVSGDDGWNRCPNCGHVNTLAHADTDTCIKCPNIKCQLTYKKVIDDSTIYNRLHQWPSLMPVRVPHHQMHVVVKQENGPQNDIQDIESWIQTEPLKTSSLNHGPDVFKRVRFISRWEDRIESRGDLMGRMGNVHVWDISHGVAGLADFQMHLSMSRHLAPHRQWIEAGEISLLDATSNHAATYTRPLGLFTGFVGITRGKALPALVLISQSKKILRRCWKLLKGLDWLGPNSQIVMLTAPVSALGSGGALERVNESLHRAVDISKITAEMEGRGVYQTSSMRQVYKYG